MIADYPEFESVNRLADLPAGWYYVVESTYELPGTPQCSAILSELVSWAETAALGADLQVILADNTILFRDFAVAPDGGWRDSFGAKANALADLLPLELKDFALVRRRRIFVDHDGKGSLQPIDDTEDRHGA
jgi:hypothetical protein